MVRLRFFSVSKKLHEFGNLGYHLEKLTKAIEWKNFNSETLRFFFIQSVLRILIFPTRNVVGGTL